MTVNHPKIIGVNLFKIIETLFHNKESLKKNSIYLKELCEILHRDSKDVKVDVMYLSSLDYTQSDFIEDTVNQRVAFLTPRSIHVMNKTTPPKNYEEFIEMFENPEKDFADPIISDKGNKLKKAFGFLKSSK